jgi:2-polyprenyl-6-methoxyphenol hydroxylase-like FAD-dependent oxidoreductase
MENSCAADFNVIITGAGLAGLSLARQLLMYTGKTVLLLDKQENPPGKSQKVGESLVQLAGYYFSKTLDLEEHLLVEHYLKYNLRFHWKTSSGKHDYWEDISSAAIRNQSNLATFQLDRNILEAHLMKINAEDPRFRFIGGAKNIKVELSENGGTHEVVWNGGKATAAWVVDCSGRPGILKRSLSLEKKNSIRHGSTWCWVDGQVNLEKLTAHSHKEVLLHRKRQKMGSFPYFLATNHFCGEGRWFWVIPLHGKTSLGLVYDHAVIRPEEVSNARKMLDWVAKDWPIFAEDFAKRTIIDEGRFVDYSYDAQQTISPARWAMSGEAGRFSDPLYSPGSDLIAIYNTLIVDAIETTDQAELEMKCSSFEQIMRVMYDAYIPSYSLSYDCLGDPEVLTLKYTWELAVYFGFYVVPFTNQLFTNRRFMQTHLRKFALFGPINKNLQVFLSDFFKWKKVNRPEPLAEPVHIDFYDMEPLRLSEKRFYDIGLTVEEAEDCIERHVERMKEFARYIVAHVYASVLGDKRVLLNKPFVNSLKLRETVFDAERMREDYARFADAEEMQEWNLNPFALEAFITEPSAPLMKVGKEAGA